MSATTSKEAMEGSLLEDASTLLMFSKTRSDSNSSSHNHSHDRSHDHSTSGTLQASTTDPSNSSARNENTDQFHSQCKSLPLTRSNTGSGTVSPRNPLASPGPASVALLEDERNEIIPSNGAPSRSSSSNNSGSNNSSSNNKGMVAAAALAAAATVPLPLKTRGANKNTQEDASRGDSGSRKGSKRRKEWPVPDSYIVHLDAGVISCICGHDDDDGFTIQCDHCNRWQHAVCYNIKDSATAPEEYLCNVCDPRKLDVKRAKKKQQERIKYLKEPNLDSSQSSNSQFAYEGTKRDSKSDNNIEDNDIRDNTNTGKSNDTNSNYNNDGGSNKTGNNNNSNKYDNSEFSNISGSGNSRSQRVIRDRSHNVSKEDGTNGTFEDDTGRKRRREDDNVSLETTQKNNGKISENVTYLSAKDAYSATYLPITSCEYKDKYMKMFIDKHNDDDWVIPYNGKPFESLPLEVKPYSEVGNSKIFPGFTKLGVYMGESCEKNDFISEITGEVYFQGDYISDLRNHYRIWGTTKPKLFFHPHLPLCIDARLSGNMARYIRRCCKPNVEIATVKVLATNEVKFLLRAKRKIEKGEEIHMNWQWDLRHPILQIMNGTATLESLNEPDKYLMIHSIHTILGSCDCACGNSKDCNLLKVKKFSQNLYKSVKSKMNNRYKLNEILNQYQGKKRRPPPILTRLVQESEDNQIKAPRVIADLNVKKLAFLDTESRITEAKPSSLKVPLILKNGAESNDRPYKWILMEKDRKKEEILPDGGVGAVSIKSTIITNPSQYDESNVTDIDLLPIPIVLEVPLRSDKGTTPVGLDSSNYTTGTGQTKYRDSTLGSSPTAAARSIPENASQSIMNAPPMVLSSYGVSKLDERNNSSSASSLADLSDHNRRPLKKKLSFADYRKKQSK